MEVKKREGGEDLTGINTPPTNAEGPCLLAAAGGRRETPDNSISLAAPSCQLHFSFDANMQPDIRKEIELGSASLQNQIKLPLGCFITLFTTERHFSGTCNLL